MTSFTNAKVDLSLIELLAPTPTDDPLTFVGTGNDCGRMGIYRKGDPDEPIEYRVQVSEPPA